MDARIQRAAASRQRAAGTAALDLFSEWQAVYIDYSGKLQKAQRDEVASNE